MPTDRLQLGNGGGDLPEIIVAIGSAAAAVIAAVAGWRKWGGGGSLGGSSKAKAGGPPDQVLVAAWQLIDGQQKEIGRLAARVAHLEQQHDDDETEIRRLRLGEPGVK